MFEERGPTNSAVIVRLKVVVGNAVRNNGDALDDEGKGRGIPVDRRHGPAKFALEIVVFRRRLVTLDARPKDSAIRRFTTPRFDTVTNLQAVNELLGRQSIAVLSGVVFDPTLTCWRNDEP